MKTQPEISNLNFQNVFHPELKFKYNSKSKNNIIGKTKINVSNFNSNNLYSLNNYLKNEAIINLIKKTKFLQLYIELITEQIDEEEYEKELNENSENYFITLKEPKSELDLVALHSVLINLPKKLTIDEISEIFGIELNSLTVFKEPINLN